LRGDHRVTNPAEFVVRSNALKVNEPHEREQHETRLRGSARRKPLRASKRPRRDGVRMEPNDPIR